MKRRLAGILMCVLAFVGCNNDVQKPESNERRVTVETRNGPVVVRDVQRKDEQKQITASVEGTQINATLRIVPAGDGVMTIGGTAMLIDASGRLLYSLEMTINQETNEVTYRQATEDDYVTLRILEANDRVRESYDANGDVASFDYPQLPEETKARTINQLEHGLSTNNLPADMREYAAQAQAFQAYYLPHANNSLTNNEAAQLMLQLLSSSEASYALIGEQPEEMNRVIQTICNLLTACSAFFCRVLPSSSLCSACVGGAFACAIFQTLGPWIWGTP